jgi:hypothetical protein
MIAMLAVPIAAALLPLLTPVAAIQAVEPPTGTLGFELVVTNGHGCPPGSIDWYLSPDNTAFVLNYRAHLASAGAGALPTDARMNCQAAVNLTAPPGYTYAISSVDYAGTAHIAAGATANARANYYSAGMPTGAYPSKRYPGPFDGTWGWTETVQPEAMVYYPCGEARMININTEVRVSIGTSDPAAASWISFNGTEGGVSTRYHLTWVACPGGA